MKINELRRIVYEIIDEELKLKRIPDKELVAVVSNLPDRKDASKETYQNKNKLSAAGFRWTSDLNSWTISDRHFKDAQQLLNSLNKLDTFVEKLEDLEEFILNVDDTSRKTELSGKIDSYITTLMDDVDEAAASEEIHKYLDFILKFHNYSFVNTMLIYIQKPGASKVAGFKQWQEKFNRKVKKGATSISIFAPTFVKDKDKYSIQIGAEAEIDKQQESDAKRLSGFRLVSVFDISDTEPIDASGEIPESPKWHATDEPNERADKLYSYAEQLAQNLGISIGNEASKRGELGWASGDHINLSSDIAGLNKASTFIHEIAHELMHFNKKSIFYIKDIDSDKKFTRDDMELQAESVSYVVLKHYGFTVKSQPKYLAMWKANKDSLKNNSDIIKKVSNFIIERIDEIADHDTEAPVS
jgi:hypothetical protein